MAVEIQLPGDKSLSHRYLIFDHLCGYRSALHNISEGADVIQTKNCLAQISQNQSELYCGNSGTTARLLTGLLTGIKGTWKLSGDKSLQARPMNRVIDPLAKVGALIKGNHLPLVIQSSQLGPIEYQLPMASAQVKSGLLLAGLVHGVPVTLTGKIASRDHTEIFLKHQGINIEITSESIWLDDSVKNLKPFEVNIPGDPSSACFLIIKRILTPGSELVLKNILLNPTRVYFLEILKQIGCLVETKNETTQLGEKVGDIHVHYKDLSELKNLNEINQSALWIDEIPALSFLMTQIAGDCLIRNVQELQFKESNRITELQRMYQAFRIQNNLEYSDGDLMITGGQQLKTNVLKSEDHRIQMTAALIDPLNVSDSINISYPNFSEHLNKLRD